jgi:hypothetical protein
MLLHIQNNTPEQVNLLIDFAKKQSIHLSIIDGSSHNTYLQGNPLSEVELTDLITKSRNSGTISMLDAHQFIKNK